MKKFKFYNTLLGWIVFLIAAYTYISTVEPTASLWDCGEFIATSYKLEVGHPPGAPFFNIVQKVVSLLAGNDVTKVAYWMNITSALSSAFTILFLFWSISHIGRRIMENISENKELTTYQMIGVLGSATVGALTYTFTDTFWFSAVEAEVYAMSSLFTALVFWLALKWEEKADEPYSDKYLILIGLLIGMSIGVHLLNLLVIPAIALIYYYRKFKKIDLVGSAIALGIGGVIVLIIMYGIIRYLIVLGSQMELAFVNGFGLPFESGFITFMILLFGGLFYGLYITYKKNNAFVHNILLFFLMIIIGYTLYAEVLIRSNANPPIDENNPENSFALVSYLGREQYGDKPLFYGPYYDADIIDQIDEYTYIRGKDKYIKIKKTNPKYVYDPSRSTIFPRMYSQDPNHIKAYKEWGDVKEGEKPNFINNLKFFFNYQLGFMYWRYFAWNFIGRQNDIQGHGGILHGNWLSGISFIDNARLGPQDKIPERWKKMPSRNVFYFLPFLLGILGLLYTWFYDKRYFWVIMVFFFMTGIAIILYLNQTPFQPRERDYAYAASFYAFSMWVGFGVLALMDMLRSLFKKDKVWHAVAVSVIALFVPIQMGFQTWDDHDRSGRYHTRDFALDYLNSCAENAILFTYGDNDTFPLWYDQEVEGIRTDVRDVNLSLFSTDWYIDQMKRKAYDSDSLPIPLKHSQYREGVRDYVMVMDKPELFVNEKFEANKDLFGNTYDTLYAELISVLEKSDLPKKKPNDFKAVQSKKLKFKQVVDFILKVSNPKIVKAYNIDKAEINKIKNKAIALYNDVKNSYLPIDIAIDFLLSDDPRTKVTLVNGEAIDYIPSRKLLIPVNKEKVLKDTLLVPAKYRNDVVNAVRFKLPRKYLLKSQWVSLVILANFDWERPIYFAASIGDENYLGLQKYFRLEGFAYRLVPYKDKSVGKNEMGSIYTPILYDNVMNKFKWGRINEPDFYVDNYVDRTIKVMNIRGVFHRLADALIKENKIDSAKKVLDKIVEIMPEEKFPYEYFMTPIIRDYFRIGENEIATELAKKSLQYQREKLNFFLSLPPDKLNSEEITTELYFISYIVNEIAQMAKTYKQDDLSQEAIEILTQVMPYVNYGYK